MWTIGRSQRVEKNKYRPIVRKNGISFCPVKSVYLFYKYRYSKYIYHYFADLSFYLTE